MMQRQFKRLMMFFALMLFGSTTAFGASPADNAAPTQEGGFNFSVGVATKDQSHPHYGEGSTLGFVINGVQGRTLVLVRGKAYTFNVNTSPMHDFYITTSPAGWGTGAVTEGVAGNFTFKGVVTFRPTEETPDLVYYGCRNHKFMGAEIHIVNPGEEDKIKLDEPVAAASAVQATGPAPDKNEVSQRLNFAAMFVNTSEAAKRIEASDNADAKGKYKAAQDKLAAATGAFDSGKFREAKANVDEAMKLMTEASKLVPSESAQKRAKSRNEELIVGVMSLQASYKQNREDLIKGGAKNLPTLDSEKIRKAVDEARALSDEGKFEESNKMLSGVMSEISGVLNNMLSNSTMSYDMKFASPDEEYGYELEHFTSLEKLIPQAIEQQQPPQTTLSLIDTYVTKGKGMRDQASAEAKQKNFTAALESIKNGTAQLEIALKLIGVK